MQLYDFKNRIKYRKAADLSNIIDFGAHREFRFNHNFAVDDDHARKYIKKQQKQRRVFASPLTFFIIVLEHQN